MSIRITTPKHLIVKLRKLKVVPVSIKAEVYKGCKEMGAAVQFNSDVNTFNVYEALLYLEGMEPQFFAEGTATKAIDAYCNTKAVRKMLLALTAGLC
jgi:hypothetical protein